MHWTIVLNQKLYLTIIAWMIAGFWGANVLIGSNYYLYSNLYNNKIIFRSRKRT